MGQGRQALPANQCSSVFSQPIRRKIAIANSMERISDWFIRWSVAVMIGRRNVITIVSLFFRETNWQDINHCVRIYYQQAFSGSCLQVQNSDGDDFYLAENTEETFSKCSIHATHKVFFLVRSKHVEITVKTKSTVNFVFTFSSFFAYLFQFFTNKVLKDVKSF